ncbi:MAG: putative glycoside hydrolase [Candidatus Colwellbacteria bacterium]|nr:putative glycoside hydrolase [Candidatus Colwellbacteria bacterium]
MERDMKMTLVFYLAATGLFATFGALTFALDPHIVAMTPEGELNTLAGSVAAAPDEGRAILTSAPEARPISADLRAARVPAASDDPGPQLPLQNPPDVIKALYATSWSAGTPSRLDHLVKLLRETEANALVIDLKDYSGFVAYDTSVSDVSAYGAREIRIPNINKLIQRLHDEGVYLIGRVSVFQDPLLARARPDLAVQSATPGSVWKDRKGLAWIDPAAREAWKYNIAIATDAIERGFDEINLDYIRFPSDGDLSAARFPHYDEAMPKHETLRAFFRFARESMPSAVLSADLFGLVTVEQGDMGIGQILEDAFAYFDYAAPMTYPSHYAPGSFGYANPAAFPYEVVKRSAEEARRRLDAFLAEHDTPNTPRLRFWLQDFDLGAEYTAEMVRKQMQALEDAGVATGWMLWDPNNRYTRDALAPELTASDVPSHTAP